MHKSNPGFLHLSQIESFIMSKADLTVESIEKIKDTVRYTMNRDPSQDSQQVIRRCMIAQMAEQYVAEYVKGHVAQMDAKYEDPYTWAWDVLAHPEYSGLRIEVKTHQSNAKWIQVSTGSTGRYPVHGDGRGINIGPFLDHNVADVLIMFDVNEINEKYEFTPVLLCDSIALTNTDLVKRSQYQGYYLNLNIRDDLKESLTLHTFK